MVTQTNLVTNDVGTQCDIEEPRQYVYGEFSGWQSNAYTCPIGYVKMENPVVLGESGSVYEFKFITMYLSRLGVEPSEMVCFRNAKVVRDPLTNVMTHTVLIPVRAMSSFHEEANDEMKRMHEEIEILTDRLNRSTEDIQGLTKRVSELQEMLGHFTEVIRFLTTNQ